MKRLSFIIAALCLSGALAFTACAPESVSDEPGTPVAADDGKEEGTGTQGQDEPEPGPTSPGFVSFSLNGRNFKQKSSEILDTCVIVTLPVGANGRELTATFDAPDATVYVEGVKQESGRGSIDFSMPVRYTIKSSDGRTGYVTVSAVFQSDIPTLFIRTGSSFMPGDTETWTEGFSLASTEPDGTVTRYGKCSMKGRGNSSWWYPKKPYNIKLDKRQEVLGMAEHKRWCLLANWMDRTSIRNDVAFEIARRCPSLAWTPHGRFVNVMINGSGKGMYYICEQVRIDENRVDITEMEHGDNSGDKISGGYLLECDIYYDEPFQFHTSSLGLPFMVKQPGVDVMTQSKNLWIKRYCNDIESRLMSSPVDGSYRDLLDADSFIDFWFVQELVTNGEPNHPKSCYMYKDRGGKLFAGPAWDFDWGTFISNERNFVDNYAIWYAYLFKDPWFRDRVKEKWSAEKAEFENVVCYIDKVAAEIRNSAIANCNMWPINQSVNGDETLTYDEAVQRLRNNYTARVKFMDRAIKNL